MAMELEVRATPPLKQHALAQLGARLSLMELDFELLVIDMSRVDRLVRLHRLMLDDEALLLLM